ncbi:type I-E CRISPR-associated protein Cse2/CasB [Streptomyces parvulus]|uniref:type I-E CRISPR-associated protein Cse2/CasB n=1 Tax=Streptomyces parvulus TaxID=146923 RepID=UPI0033307475
MTLAPDTPPAPQQAARSAQDYRDHYDSFVAQVRALCTAPAVRRTLESGRGRDLRDFPHGHPAHRYLIRHVHSWPAQRAHYTVAALIASQTRRISGDDPTTVHVPRQAPPPDAATPTAPAAAANETGDLPTAVAAAQAARLWWRRPNLGRSLAEAAQRRSSGAAPMASRMELLLRLPSHTMQPRLPGLCRLVMDSGVRIDWAVLLSDLSTWETRRSQIANRWKEAFYLHSDPLGAGPDAPTAPADNPTA